MNIIESFLSAEFIRAFAWALFHSIWQGGLIALLAIIFIIILRKHQPGIRYSILCMLMMLLPVFFIVTFLVIYNNGNISDHISVAAAGNTFYVENENISEITPLLLNEPSRAWYISLVYLFENQAKWLVLIWFTGFFIFLIRFAGSISYVYRLKNYQVYPVDEIWKTKLRRLSDKIGLHRSVSLVESALTRIPVTIGYLKPVILLPIGTLSGVSPQQIDAILLHELAHIMRKDYLLNIIQSVIELMFFYHPVTWWLSTQIRQEREHICDDLVIDINHDRINYIKALTTMEELNSKTPVLVSAMTGPKKKLLFRVKRLISPAKIRKGFNESVIAFILLVFLFFTLSLNALSIIPNSFDLRGRESGGKHFNILPFDPDVHTRDADEGPLYQPLKEIPRYAGKADTLVKKIKSGNMIIEIINDSTNAKGEKEIEVLVKELDKDCGEWDNARHDFDKQVIIMKSKSGQIDSLQKITVIKSGDSIKVIKGDSVLWFGEASDNSIVTDEGFQFYGFDIPDMPEMPEADLKYFYFNDENVEWDEEHGNAVREYEFQMKDLEREHRSMEKDHRLMEKELRDIRVMVPPPDVPRAMHWTQGAPLSPYEKNSEKIIRQELRDDGLAFPHKKYIIELDSKAMYINGEKQPKEIYRKYSKLVESLDEMKLEDVETFKMIF